MIRNRASSQGCPLACGVTVPIPAAPSAPKGHEAPAWQWRELECGNIPGWSPGEQSLGQEMGSDVLRGLRTCWGRSGSGGGIQHHCSSGALRGVGEEMQLVSPALPVSPAPLVTPASRESPAPAFTALRGLTPKAHEEFCSFPSRAARIRSSVPQLPRPRSSLSSLASLPQDFHPQEAPAAL